MSIRVLQVLDKISDDSGVSSVVMNYYSVLNHDEITFDFMLNEDVDQATRTYIESNGSVIYIMPRLRFANLIKYISALKQFYRNKEYQIIHGHVANSAVFYLGLARKKVPHRIIHSHSTKGADVWWKRIRNWLLTRFVSNVANKYVACSTEAARFLFGKRNDAVVLNNAICVDKYLFDSEKRERIRRELALWDSLVIGHVGRFIPLKNHEFLLDVFYEIHKKEQSTALLLIGNGELFNKMEEKAKKLGLYDAVVFLGVRDNVGEYMNAMDVFVLPSRFEGLGIVGVEAQASGLRVFVSENVPRVMDFTGSVEYLKLDKELWVNRLLKGYKDLERSEQGKKAIGSQFDIKTQAERLSVYYMSMFETLDADRENRATGAVKMPHC